jgi:hypothetical protein
MTAIRRCDQITGLQSSIGYPHSVKRAYTMGETITMKVEKNKVLPVNDLMTYSEATQKAKLLVRPVDKATWRNYGALWADGVKLNEGADPIAVGTYPNPETSVLEKIVGDGIHRLTALKHAIDIAFREDDEGFNEDEIAWSDGLEADERARLQGYADNGLAVQFVTYESKMEAAADQLRRNLSHGKAVKEVERDKRILMLRDLGMDLEKIGDIVGLHKASVSRILAGKQNLSGTSKGGGKRSRTAKPMDGKAILKALERACKAIEADRSVVVGISLEELAAFKQYAETLEDTVTYVEGEKAKHKAAPKVAKKGAKAAEVAA